jgi:hypothetical protein
MVGELSHSIAVCIPTRNQAGFIMDALRSAFAQTVIPRDVIVADDAGTDGTEAVVERFRTELLLEQRARLRYDRNPQQLGIGGNFDRAVRLAKGEFVVKLDSDDSLEPQFIAVLLAHLEASPRAGWAHCNVLNVRPDLKPIGLAHTRKKSGFYAASGALPAYLNHNDTCHCVMLRKSAYLEVGGYRTEMRTCEDWLLWLEMLFAGWGYCFDERPLAKMRKYDARPALMAKRRKDFVDSARTMVPIVEELCRRKEAQLLGMPSQATWRLRRSMARLCVSSACDEANPQVRTALFEAACEFAPSLRNQLWLLAASPLPAPVTRAGMKLANLPRRLARTVLQKLRGPVRSPARA